MKLLISLRTLLFFCILSLTATAYGQVTVWTEDFSSYSNGTISGAGTGASPAAWNSQTGAPVNAGRILASNTRGVASSTLANPLIWVTNPINISAYTNVSFSVDTGAFDPNQFENTGGSQDNFALEYRINGTGGWIQLFSRSGSTSQPVNPSYSAGSLSGNTIELRATFHNTATNENYTIDNVLVTGFPLAPNEPPVLVATGDQVYCPGTSMPVVETISITDPDDTTAFAVAIQISTGYVNGEDLLTLTGVHPSITQSWSPVEGKLTLTGPATLAEFETAISAVEYSSSALLPAGIRGFSIIVGDANYLPPTGHFYEFVAVPGITWTAARTAASLRTYYGLQGYLATLTSQQEADFSGSQALGVGWIGANDDTTEGDWQWVTGPEAGTSFWSGGVGGTELTYAFWNANEPNDFPDGPVTPGQENFAHITDPSVTTQPGSWNDLPNAGGGGAYAPQGYVVEYGGMPGDPILNISDNTLITIDNVPPTASNPTPINLFCLAELPLPDVTVVTDEADNCTATPLVVFLSDVTDGGSYPEIITRTYRITDASGNSTDVTQTITINNFNITTQPIDQLAFAGTDTVFTVIAANVDSYQWQVSTNGGSSFSNLTDGPQYSGTTTAILTLISPDLDKNGYIYRVQMLNSGSVCPRITSGNALLNIRIGSIITNKRITKRIIKF